MKMPTNLTTNSTLTVLIGEDIGPANLARLRNEFPNVDFRFCMQDAEWLEIAPHANIILSKRWPAEAMKRTLQLRWVQAGTAGVDHLLRFDLSSRGVIITNSSGAHGDPISELILSHMLAFATGLNKAIRAQSERRYVQKEINRTKFELVGQTLCVVGLGDIGGTLARKAAALGMHVIGVRRSTRPIEGVSQIYTNAQLHTALAQADHVALCLPLTNHTRHFIGANELRAMRPTAYIYNVGRGASIDEAALVEALKSGVIAGAGLDVTDPEPVPLDSPLWEMPNVILSQHTSGMSPHNANRVTELFAANLRRYLADEPLQQLIDPARGY
jgi:phosphoglycerate dehydrogenase-like enzyme